MEAYFVNRHRSAFSESSQMLFVASDFAALRASVWVVRFKILHSDSADAKYHPLIRGLCWLFETVSLFRKCHSPSFSSYSPAGLTNNT